MNKKLLAAAIAAAAALPMAAQAGVQIYGVVHASIDYVDADVPDIGDYWDVTSNTSRIGFKGSEDLGNGLKAIWKMEGGWNIAEGGFNGNRNSYIGLAGDWGTFLYGRHDTPLKISTGKLDLFADRQADYNFACPGSNGIACAGLTDRRQSDAIAYISPNMNGLTFAAAIIPGFDAGLGADGLADGYSIAAMYSNNGLFVSAAYENINDWLADGAEVLPGVFVTDDEVWRVGLGYEMNAFSIGFIYENEEAKAQGLGTVYDADKFYINAGYTFGNNVVKGMYYTADNDEADDGDAWAIGLDHNLSNRTTAYLLYTQTDFTDVGALDGGLHNYGYPEADGFAMGMIHKF